ncbi:Hypothetical_protein [Hexamita inflata]|uniref:Hypothetical_protein n=1 Tax=Hexamita inflata TaxID=28002 RepID=A0ABP1H4T7_9EUKA
MKQRLKLLNLNCQQNLIFLQFWQSESCYYFGHQSIQQQIEYIGLHYIQLGFKWKSPGQLCSDVPGRFWKFNMSLNNVQKQNTIFIADRCFALLAGYFHGESDCLQNSNQTIIYQSSPNNKSSILVYTTSNSDLNGSRRDSSVVTFRVGRIKLYRGENPRSPPYI